MSEVKSKRWIWYAVGGLVLVGLIIWASTASAAGAKTSEESDQEDINETAKDIIDKSMSPTLRECRKSCRIICKTKYMDGLSKRTKCKRKCKSDCRDGVDVIKNGANY